MMHRRYNYEYGVFKNNRKGILALLKRLYQLIDRLPELFNAGRVFTGFIAQFPNALPHQTPTDVDFARWIKKTLMSLQAADTKFAGWPQHVYESERRDKTKGRGAIQMALGGIGWSIQAGHPGSERKTRRMNLPTIAFVPDRTLLYMNSRSTPEAIRRQVGRAAFAIRAVQVQIDGLANPITNPNAALPKTCHYSGMQDYQRMLRENLCPWELTKSHLKPGTCKNGK
jgi:hypothetical protein